MGVGEEVMEVQEEAVLKPSTPQLNKCSNGPTQAQEAPTTELHLRLHFEDKVFSRVNSNVRIKSHIYK